MLRETVVLNKLLLLRFLQSICSQMQAAQEMNLEQEVIMLSAQLKLAISV